MTPSEIIASENKGISFIKLFPGNLLGPEFVSSIKEIFPKLLFMPTGGVDTTKENLQAWFPFGRMCRRNGQQTDQQKINGAKRLCRD
jgi:2-dehydro-3-deoxyphosphogluconate aldolase/(4S)-4-hydroxy-2-oxoglutarate aldolase